VCLYNYLDNEIHSHIDLPKHTKCSLKSKKETIPKAVCAVATNSDSNNYDAYNWHGNGDQLYQELKEITRVN
jgi:hypothetical protein